MYYPTIAIGFTIFIMAIMIIAVNSIGIEGYNKLKTSKDDESKKFAESKGTNLNTLTFSLICAIILLIIGCLMSIGGIAKSFDGVPGKEWIPVVTFTTGEMSKPVI